MVTRNFLPLDVTFSFLKNYRFQILCIWVYLSIMFFSGILCRRIVAGFIEQYVLFSNLNML